MSSFRAQPEARPTPPEETPEEVEHMGSPQLLHLYPPEDMLVGPGIALEEVAEICVEA